MALLELKKDISSPDGYWRAGDTRELSEWQKVFHKMKEYDMNEWFYDLSKIKHKEPKGLISEVVIDVFNKRELYSLSYRDAAMKASQIIIDKLQITDKVGQLRKENGLLKSIIEEAKKYCDREMLAAGFMTGSGWSAYHNVKTIIECLEKDDPQINEYFLNKTSPIS